MKFPLLTGPGGDRLSINPRHIVDIKPYGYNGAEPMPPPNGVQSKVVWRWPGGADTPPMITQTFCCESVAAIVAQLNGTGE